MLLWGLVGRAVSAADLPDYGLLVGEAKPMRGEFSMRVRTPQMKARQWVLVAAIPPRLTGQPQVDAKFNLPGQRCQEQGRLARPFFRAVVPVRPQDANDEVTIRIDYLASLCNRQLVRRAAGTTYHEPEPLTKDERAAELAATDLVDFKSGDFRDWQIENDLDRRPGEADLDYARRIFLAIKNDFQYEYKETMDRRASHVCRAGRSDCGGMSILFVALARSAAIPARVLAGRLAESAASQQAAAPSEAGSTQRKPSAEADYGQHVKAEFYLDQVGWVPVDCSSAVLFDKSAAGLKFFGYDPGDFLTLHIDPEMTVDALRFGKHKLTWLQAPSYWVSGVGSMAGATTSETWQVERPEGDTP